jgi:DNA-binding winged helix-turn-helix (wHTH) protein/tetratricopeptide (TPR) repeat protein
MADHADGVRRIGRRAGRAANVARGRLKNPWGALKPAQISSTARHRTQCYIAAASPPLRAVRMDTAPKILYEFGPFRIDPDQELLLRDGRAVAVTPKALEVLLVLVRRSREVVSKDELMRSVWPTTVVEEANLSQSVFMLRKALGDTRGERRYIVTLPGRGYRFAARVREIAGDSTEHAPEVVDTPVAASGERRWRKSRVAWLAVGGVIALAAGAVYLLRDRPVERLHAQDPVLVADFANTTGDPVFDDTLRQGLAVQLQQSPLLSLISQDRIQQTLRMMERATDTPLTPELAREVCERTDGALVLDGSIARLGNRYVLGLRARDCYTGDVLDQQQVQAAGRDDVLEALDEIAARFRQRVGESPAVIARHNVPLAEATTKSLDALKAYSMAAHVHAAAGPAAALPLYRRAVRIDPQFAMAHAMLGRVHGDLGEFALAAQSTAQAWRLRERASDAEKFFIDASYQLQVTGNLQSAQRICESWARTYPRAMEPHALLAGIVLPVQGNYRAAAGQARTALRLDPDFAIGYELLAYAQQYQGDFDGARRALDAAAARKLAMPDFVLQRYDLAFLRADSAGMARQQAAAVELDEAKNGIVYHQSLALAYTGKLQEARALSAQAEALSLQSSSREQAALFDAGAALREGLYGHAAAARQRAREALALSDDSNVEFGAAFALALAGDSAQASKLADDLATRFAQDTSATFSYLPALRARLALNRHAPQEAIAALQVAVPYDLGAPRSSMHGSFGALYTVYVRGEAYLAAGRGADAAGEFRKVLAHRGVVATDPVGALARLQLARAYAMQGQARQAQAAYRSFLALWQAADPDIPVLVQARREYASLKIPCDAATRCARP